MANIRSWLHIVGMLKCPRCKKGDMFTTPTFSFRKPFEMHKNCPHCNQRFELEVGFYYGAMFVSYIITAFSMFGLFGIMKFGIGLDVIPAFAVSMGIILFLYVWVFRVSRTVWLSFFVKSDEKYM